MTGFGRATVDEDSNGQPVWFASHAEGVQPDFLVLAKGLTGGYLPMAATLTTQRVFDVFLGRYEEFKSFFHGHSYTGNALGSAVALANVELLETKRTRQQRHRLAAALRTESAVLWELPQVGDMRQCGLILAVELVEDWKTRKPLALKDRAGFRVCEAMARRGVLTRPIGNVIVVMPPYCTTPSQVQQILTCLHDSIVEIFPNHPKNSEKLEKH
jgi:adenosylmethionine-8-amino-7-oxononanoate aminotransferase